MINIKQADIQAWIDKSARIFIKKLSRNDCLWAEGQEHGHQNGVYIPREIREHHFFPPLSNINPLKPHILETELITYWPATDTFKSSNLKHYTNKGNECHLTGIPKDYFTELTPASLLLGGTMSDKKWGFSSWFMVINSDSDEAEFIETLFDLDADFRFALFDPKKLIYLPQNETEILIQELSRHFSAGTLQEYISSVSTLPSPDALAFQAQNEYLLQKNLVNLDPYSIPNPGDVIMKISRDIEYKIYKRAELHHRAAEVIRIISAGGKNIVEGVVRGFSELDATFLSASQHRKSRAGRSFEFHIARVLRDGHIMFEEQAVTGGRRPDFVLPNLIMLNKLTRSFNDALVLSAKTTLRERWKQITLEKFNGALFLATVDDRVSSEAIADMHRQDICLVVPESLKTANETCYKNKTNVISFRTFFDEQISQQRPFLRMR